MAWMNLKGIRSAERSQSKKVTSCMRPLRRCSWKGSTVVMENNQWAPRVRSGGRARAGSVTTEGWDRKGFWGWWDCSVSQLCCGGYMKLNMYWKAQKYTLKKRSILQYDFFKYWKKKSTKTGSCHFSHLNLLRLPKEDTNRENTMKSMVSFLCPLTYLQVSTRL